MLWHRRSIPDGHWRTVLQIKWADTNLIYYFFSWTQHKRTQYTFSFFPSMLPLNISVISFWQPIFHKTGKKENEKKKKIHHISWWSTTSFVFFQFLRQYRKHKTAHTESAKLLYAYIRERKSCINIWFSFTEIPWLMQVTFGLHKLLKRSPRGGFMCLASVALVTSAKIQWDCCICIYNVSSQGHQCSAFPVTCNILHGAPLVKQSVKSGEC